MVADETRTTQILTDHHTELTAIEDHAWHQHGQHRFGVSYLQGYRRARRDTLTWVLHHLTRGFDALTNSEVITELRKGDQSLYWPLFMEDPQAWLLCDHCRTRQLFDARGICDHCGIETE